MLLVNKLFVKITALSLGVLISCFSFNAFAAIASASTSAPVIIPTAGPGGSCMKGCRKHDIPNHVVSRATGVPIPSSVTAQTSGAFAHAIPLSDVDTNLPSGSYKKTCHSCHYDSYSEGLSCKCSDNSGSIVNTRAVINSSCTYVSSKDGFLQCDSYNPYYKKPAGNYVNTCGSCEWNSDSRVLSCGSCAYTVKKYANTTLHVKKDCLKVENINGKLQCTKMKYHFNARKAWVGALKENKYVSPGLIWNNNYAQVECMKVVPLGYSWKGQWRSVAGTSVCEYVKGSQVNVKSSGGFHHNMHKPVNSGVAIYKLVNVD
jgi:hypothetical protein